MAVIINEFEVVTDEGASGEQSGAARPADAGAAPGPSPLDLADILRQRAERLARLEAY